jgi:drug/metabolite transporter (DMT)-like permease
VPAALTSVVLLLQPVASVALAAAVLDERPSRVQLLGCAIVLAGVVAATAGRRPRRQPQPVRPAEEVASWT